MLRKESLDSGRHSIKFLPVRNLVEREEGVTFKKPLLPKISIVDHIPDLHDRPTSNRNLRLMLLFSTICSSLVGPLLIYVEIEVMLKLFWRQIIIVILLCACSPFIPEESNSHSFKHYFKRFPKFLKGGFWHCLSLIFFALSVEKTSLGNSYILSNMDLLSLVILRRIYINSRLSKNEKIGIGTAFACILLCFLDHVSIGNVFALLSSLASCFFLVWGEESTSNKSWRTFTIVNFISMIILGIISWIFKANIEFSRDTQNGLFGVFTLEWLPLHLVIALIVGLGSSALLFKLSKGLTDFENKFSSAFQAPLAAIFGYLFHLTCKNSH